MKARVAHLFVSKIAYAVFLIAGFKFVHSINALLAYVMLGAHIVKIVANELYLYDLIVEVEKEGMDELDRLFKKIKGKDDDNV